MSLLCRFYAPLANATIENDLVFMCRFIDNDPSKYIFGDTLRAWVALVDAWMAKEGSSPGFILLFDMTGMQLSHLPRVNLALMAKFFFYLQVRL